MILSLPLVQDKHVHIPGDRQLLIHHLKLHIPQSDGVPKNLENIGVIGGQNHLLLQPVNIVLADGDLGDLHGLMTVFHLFVPMQRNGSLLVIELLHLCRHRNQCLDVQLAGIDHPHRQILHLAVYRHRVRRHCSLEIDLFLKGNPALQHNKAAARLHGVIQHRIGKPAPHRNRICRRLYLVDDDFSLFQIQGTHIRLIFRNVYIILQRELSDRLCPGAIHMYISF